MANGIFTAVTVTALDVGDVVTGADSGSHTQITKATAAALLKNANGWGVAILGASPGFLALYAGAGATVSAASIGLTATGTKAFAIIDTATARVVRKVAPELGDYVIGEIDTHGNLYVDPHGAQSSDIVVGGPGYECDQTGNVDCSAVIQKAINDSQVHPEGIRYFKRRVHIPHGRYALSKPLIVRDGSTEIYGDGQASTALIANFCGPAINCNPLVAPFPRAVGFDGGMCLDMNNHTGDTDNRRWLELSSYGDSMRLNGAPNLSIRFILKIPTGGATGNLAFLNSFGRRFSTDPNGGGAEMFKIYFSPTTHQIGVSWWRNSGRIGGITTGADAWVENQWTEVTLTMNSAGVLLVYSGPAGIVGGPITLRTQFTVGGGTNLQQPWERINLGACVSPNYVGEQQSEDCVIALLASLEMSDNQRVSGGTVGTTTYASTGVRFQPDANTLWHSNFATVYENCVYAVTRSTVGGTVEPTYLPTQHGALGAGYANDNVQIHDLSITSGRGSGITMTACNGFLFERLNISAGTAGILARNNCYNGNMSRIFCTGGTYARVGIDLGINCYNTVVDSVQTWGFDYGVVAKDTAGVIGSTYLIRSKQAGVWGINCNNLHIIGVNFSDEGAPGTDPNTAVLLTAVQTALITGCVIGVNAGTGAVVDWGDGGQFGNLSNVTLSANNIGTHPGHLGYVKVRVGNMTQGTSRLEWHNNGLIDNPPVLHLTADSSANSPMFVYPECLYGNLPVALTDANTTLTREQWFYGVLSFTGALTADRTITGPALDGPFHTVYNGTTGAHNLLFKALGGSTTLSVAPGASMTIRSTGTEFVQVS